MKNLIKILFVLQLLNDSVIHTASLEEKKESRKCTIINSTGKPIEIQCSDAYYTLPTKELIIPADSKPHEISLDFERGVMFLSGSSKHFATISGSQLISNDKKSYYIKNKDVQVMFDGFTRRPTEKDIYIKVKYTLEELEKQLENH